MAETDGENGNTQVTFDQGELAAVRDIVTDWIDEQVVVPPYSEEVNSVIRKLGLTEEVPSEPTQPPVQVESL